MANNNEYIDILPYGQSPSMEEITESYIDFPEFLDKNNNIKKVYVETEDEKQVSISIENLYKELSNTVSLNNSSDYFKVITTDGKSAKISKKSAFNLVSKLNNGILPVIKDSGVMSLFDSEKNYTNSVALLYNNEKLTWKKLPHGIWSGDVYNTYQVSASVDSKCVTDNIVWGSITSGIGNYISGETVTISATPTEGYYFSGWYNSKELNDDKTDFVKINSNPSYSFKMPENNLYLIARFDTIPQEACPVYLNVTNIMDFNNISMDALCDGVKISSNNISSLIEKLKTSVPKNSDLKVRMWGFDRNNYISKWTISGLNDNFEIGSEEDNSIKKDYILIKNVNNENMEINVSLLSTDGINSGTMNSIVFKFNTFLIKSITITDVTYDEKSKEYKDKSPITLSISGETVNVSNSFLTKLKEEENSFGVSGKRISYILYDNVSKDVTYEIENNILNIKSNWNKVNSIKLTQSFSNSHIGKLFYRTEYIDINNNKKIIYGDSDDTSIDTIEKENPNSNEIIISDAALNKEIIFYFSTYYNYSLFEYYPRWYFNETVNNTTISRELSDIYKTNDNGDYYLLKSKEIKYSYTPESGNDTVINISYEDIKLNLNCIINHVHETENITVDKKINPNDYISIIPYIKQSTSNYLSYDKSIYDYHRGDYIKVDYIANNNNGIGYLTSDSNEITIENVDESIISVNNESNSANELLYHVPSPEDTSNSYSSKIIKSINFSIVFNELKYDFCNGAPGSYINTYLNFPQSSDYIKYNISDNIINGSLFIEKTNEVCVVGLKENINKTNNIFNYINSVSGYNEDILREESMKDSFNGILSETREYDVTFTPNAVAGFYFYGWLISESSYNSLTDSETISNKYIICNTEEYKIKNFTEETIKKEDLEVYKYTITGIFILNESSINDSDIEGLLNTKIVK